MSEVSKNANAYHDSGRKFYNILHSTEATRVKRRPRVLDATDAIDCLFSVVCTGMQWSEVRSNTASYTSNAHFEGGAHLATPTMPLCHRRDQTALQDLHPSDADHWRRW